MKFGNLLVIANSYPDSASAYSGNIFVKEQISYLKDYFQTVCVISPTPYGMERFRKTHHDDYRFENVRVHFPKYLNFPLFYFCGRRFWVSQAERAIKRLLRKEKLQFDLIHAHATWPSGCIGVGLGKEFRCPVVITEHTSSTVERASCRQDRHFVKAWEQCDAIIRVRRGDVYLFEDVGITSEKVHCIPNGYDAAKFYPANKQFCREQLGLPDNRKIVLTVSNLYDAVKGHNYLVEAMVEVVKNRNDVLCVIVGDGKLRAKIEKQIASENLHNFIFMVGNKPHHEIPIWMNACDLFVLPSLRESFGVVQIEAMACGKPVVATRNGGSEEILSSEDYGILCEPKNSQELAQSILIALDKEWDCNRILEYVKQYAWENCAVRIIKIYEDICKKKTSSVPQ